MIHLPLICSTQVIFTLKYDLCIWVVLFLEGVNLNFNKKKKKIGGLYPALLPPSLGVEEGEEEEQSEGKKISQTITDIDQALQQGFFSPLLQFLNKKIHNGICLFPPFFS